MGSLTDEEEAEEEEPGRGNHLLGFMFGNVDNSGDLDVDYLDKDAKEHLAALADKLGSSLTDMELSVKSSHLSADAAEQGGFRRTLDTDWSLLRNAYGLGVKHAGALDDVTNFLDYDEKAEDAVDYEDIDEQYEGPEIQASGEEDHLLPKKEYFSSQLSLARLDPARSAFDDDDYDEIEEEEPQTERIIMERMEARDISSTGQQDVPVASGNEELPRDGIECGLPKEEEVDSDLEKYLDEDYDAPEEPQPGEEPPKLPILYVEDGTVILRFSEIFGVRKSLKKSGKQEQRYSVFRDKYKSLDLSHIVEEDEEAFLKSYAPVSMNHPHVSQHGSVVPELALHEGGEEDDEVSTQSKQQGHKCCLSAEPLELGSAASLFAELQLLSSPKFYPLDQQDWEEQIVWDNSATVSETSMEFCDNTEIASRVSSIKETEQGSAPHINCMELPTNMEEKHQYIHRSSVVLESFKVDSPEPGNFTSIENRYHPQLLRLESQLAVDESDIPEGGEKSTTQPFDGDTFQRFDKLSLQNKDIMEGYWLDVVIWDEPPRVKPKLIIDLQDKQMLFELSDHMDSENLHLHAAAMVISPSPMPRVSLEMLGHGYQAGWQFNIANDKFYSKGKVSQQLQQNSSKRSAYGIKVHHSAPAIKLQTVKFKLSNKDLANFHRSKALWYPHDIEVAVKVQGKPSTLRPMKIILKSLGGKGTKLHVDANETISSVKAKASKKLDFKLSEAVKIYYQGKELEDLKSLASQNVQPNSLLHLVRTRVHLLPRAQRIPGDNKSLRPPGAFKKKSDLSVKDGHVFLMEYCEERPLLLSNPGMGANLCSYYQKSSPSDQTGVSLGNGTSFGNAMTLEPSDKSPFLGDIRAGFRQSALITNMYKAPVFPHKVPSIDFLLVRSAKGKLSLRRIDRMAVVGQQEPLMEVFAPGSKNLQAHMLNRLVVHVYREFREAEKRGVVPWVRVEELTTLFPNLSETIVRKRLKECAVLRRDAKGHLHWSKKRDFTIPSEEDLKKLVTPENVCAYESMQAGMYRLRHLGITRLTLSAGVSAATSQLPDEAIALAAASHIERELQITPWSLSGNFVACLNQDRENIERLEITGVGDPSGRGLGFSYVRATPKAPATNALTKKKAAAGRGGTTVTGTDADLRRLSMEAAREVLAKFNVPDELIAKLTRWHRIAMIRKLSSEQAASGVKVDPTTISKYARGQRMSFLQLQQQTREKCQEIWDRQVQSLSALDADYNQSDTEENSDLDSFAGDLENLLDAEEFEDVDNYGSKHEKLDGVKGLKMRRRPSQTQAEEEIEDEAAEAAELCRLLVDDDLTEQKKKKKPKASVAVNTVPPPVTKLNSVLNTENVRKPKKVQPNGSFTPKEDAVGAFKEGEMMFVKKNLSEKKKPMLKNNSSNLTPVTPRIKIVAETSKSQIFKEKKSARESFVCGACGQLGHMKTNKHCPKYREGSEALVEAADFEKASGKSTSTDMPSQSEQKTGKKRTMIKRATNAEPSESQKSTMKAKVIPVKIKCGSTEKFVDKPADGSTKSMEPPSTSDVQAIESDLEIASKAKKIKVSTKAKAEDVQVEARRPSLVIRSPAETQKSQAESQKAPLVTLPSTTVGNDRVLSRKPSIVIRPPAEKERELAHKKVVFKRSKEVIDLDQVSLDGDFGFEYRKTKKIVDLASFDQHGMREKNHFMGDSTKKKAREDRRWSGDERKRRTDDRIQEDMSRNVYRDGIGMFEEQDRVDLRRYEEGDWREEQLRPKKNKKKKRPESIDVFSEDSGGRGRSDKRIPERFKGVKRRPAVELGRYGAEHASSTKRRRGGEVGLANILERIVDALKANGSVSYLFLFPVQKKIAPDYYDIIKEPMDLSTIRDKIRNMEYRNREEFRHDVCQITINAHKYNDRRNPDIPPLADQLLELCDFLLNEHDESLTEAEERIEL